MLFQASPDEMEGQLDNGLIIGHAYSITDVRYVSMSLPGDSGQVQPVGLQRRTQLSCCQTRCTNYTFQQFVAHNSCRTQEAGAVIGCFK